VSSHLSSATRRKLNPRQAETVARLVQATEVQLREVGYDGLTVRTVAATAEVAPATAYTYFGSKAHLVAETFWRLLQSRPHHELQGGDPVDRVIEVFRDLATFLSEEPALAEATTTALLGPDPDVRRLRRLIAGEINGRLQNALGPKPDPGVLETLSLAWSGSMLQAGMGYSTYAQMGDQLARATRTVMGR
jgi:AcrR family transcriptional regulator